MHVHRNFIFVTPIEANESRLVLPPIFQQQMENAKRGVVKFAGPLSPVKPGETIVFDKWSGGEISLKGQRLLIMQPNAVIAVEE